MSVLIGILITFLVIILVLYLINMLPLDGRAKQIARVIVIIIGVISLLKYLAVFYRHSRLTSSFRDAPLGAGPESITPNRGYGPGSSIQVGCCRLWLDAPE
jgi:hypothetical protein